jgi:flagellar basal body-associated protein FliL
MPDYVLADLIIICLLVLWIILVLAVIIYLLWSFFSSWKKRRNKTKPRVVSLRNFELFRVQEEYPLPEKDFFLN